MDREQEVGFARGRCPFAFIVQHAAGHHRVHMDVPPQVLSPGMQHQTEGWRAVRAAHPFRVGGKLRQGRRYAGKQRINYPAWVCSVQVNEVVRQRKHQMRIRHRQHLGQSPLQPGIFGARAALRAASMAARVVLPASVASGITGQLLTTQRSCATGNDCPPGFRLRGAQDARCQIRGAELTQRIGEGGHG
jgi:hypothetical protein